MENKVIIRTYKLVNDDKILWFDIFNHDYTKILGSIEMNKIDNVDLRFFSNKRYNNYDFFNIEENERDYFNNNILKCRIYSTDMSDMIGKIEYFKNEINLILYYSKAIEIFEDIVLTTTKYNELMELFNKKSINLTKHNIHIIEYIKRNTKKITTLFRSQNIIIENDIKTKSIRHIQTLANIPQKELHIKIITKDNIIGYNISYTDIEIDRKDIYTKMKEIKYE